MPSIICGAKVSAVSIREGEWKGRGGRGLTNIQRHPLSPFRPSMLLYIAACSAPANMLPTVIKQVFVSIHSLVPLHFSSRICRDGKKEGGKDKGDGRTRLTTMIKTNSKS